MLARMERCYGWSLHRHFVTSLHRNAILCQSTTGDKRNKNTTLSGRLRQAVLEGQDTAVFFKALKKAKKERSSSSGETIDSWNPIESRKSKRECFLVDEEVQKQNRLPVEVRCFDTAKIYVQSGAGGNGCVAFHREKYVPKGGPSGGNGGRGGHVWAVADNNYNSLQSFRNKVHYYAGRGGHGKGSDLTGAQGEDSIVLVPPGTVIRYSSKEAPPLAELFKHGDRALLATGGRGGRGNAAFKTARNTAPTLAENGAPGEEHWLQLELKLVADVGIIGIPNAGKSTFLSVISAAKPKIADYPFTTLVPNLGVCDIDFETTVFADVPGLLEGAAQGHGLGHEFLRHCMRCRALIHIVDGLSPDPLGDYEAVQLELQLFSPELASKPQIVCYSKTDIPDAEILWEDVKQELIDRGVEESRVFPISAVSGKNTESAVRAIRKLLKEIPKELEPQTDALNLQEPLRDFENPKIEEFDISVQKDVSPHTYVVSGEAIERFTSMTNWTYYEALRRFQRVLDRAGVSDALREAGIQEGDDVRIGNHVFSWSDENSEQDLYRNFKMNQRMERRAPKGATRWPHGA